MPPENKKSQKIPELLEWQAANFISPKRSASWYIGFGIVGLILTAYALYDRSILTLITFSMIIVAVFLLSRQSPRLLTYTITKTGIYVGNSLYPYNTIKTFWIVYNPPEVKTLNFETTAYVNSQVTLQLGNQDPLQVKNVLSKYLPEDLERDESVSEILARKLKI